MHKFFNKIIQINVLIAGIVTEGLRIHSHSIHRKLSWNFRNVANFT